MTHKQGKKPKRSPKRMDKFDEKAREIDERIMPMYSIGLAAPAELVRRRRSAIAQALRDVERETRERDAGSEDAQLMEWLEEQMRRSSSLSIEKFRASECIGDVISVNQHGDRKTVRDALRAALESERGPTVEHS